MRGRAPRQRERRPKTAGRGQELLGPAWPGVQASLRGDQPDATQGITKAARGLGGRYPRYPGQLRADTQTLACEQVLQETLGGNAGQSAGWAPGSGVGEWPPAILPARCEQKASAQSCHPRSPRLFRAACRCHAQGCSQQVGAARWAPPLTPPCPHRSVQVLLAVLQHVHNGPHGQQRSPGSEVTRSWAERLQGDRDQLGRKLPWHSSLPRRLPRWHSAAPLGPTDPLSLQIHST